MENNGAYLECFEYWENGWLHVDVRVGVGAGRKQVLERVAECGGRQVKTVDDGQCLQQEERVTTFTVALEDDDRHNVCDHAEHDEDADHIQLDDRLEVARADVPRQQQRHVGPRRVGR